MSTGEPLCAQQLAAVIRQGELRQSAITAKQNQLTQAMTFAQSEYDLMNRDAQDTGLRSNAIEAVNNMRTVAHKAFDTVIAMGTEFGFVNTSVKSRLEWFLSRNQRFFTIVQALNSQSTPSEIKQLNDRLQDAGPRIKKMLSVFYSVLSSNLSREREVLIQMQSTS